MGKIVNLGLRVLWIVIKRSWIYEQKKRKKLYKNDQNVKSFSLPLKMMKAEAITIDLTLQKHNQGSNTDTESRARVN